jgi:hypothetical protein
MNTNTNISWTVNSHYGYIGGGDVANVLAASNPTTVIPVGAPAGTTNAYMIGYLGINDGGTIVANHGLLLSFNGVPYSAANVQNGLYTFWSYEHTYLLPSTPADVTTVANGIADVIFNGDATITGVQLDSNLLVKRTADGGVISKNF